MEQQMILSRSHHYIFLKTSKTAGTSFEIALSKYAGPDDIITPIAEEDERLRSELGYRGPQNHLQNDDLSIDTPAGRTQRLKYYNHIPAAHVLKMIGAPLFSSLLKVSIVRNPFDMAVSRFFWDNRHQQNLSQLQFKQWLMSRPSILLKNQTITHVQNKCAVDFMIRFESFESDVTEFSSRVGLPPELYAEFRSIRTKSQHRPSRASAKAMFGGFDEGRLIIEEMFKQDIEFYGYSLG